MQSLRFLGRSKAVRLRAAVFLVRGAAVAGAGRAAHASSPVTVTVWTWRSPDAPMWQQVQKNLQASGQNIHIDFSAKISTQYDAVLQTAMTGGKGPDIFYSRAGAGTQKYAAAGLIAPLDGKVDFSKVAPSTLSQATYQGKRYGVPFATETIAVFYNKAIFKQYGLTPPATWNDFIKICETLKSHNVTPLYIMGIQQWMLGLSVDAIGASTVGNSWARDLVNRKTGYNSAPYVRTLQKFQQLVPYFEHNYSAVGSGGQEQEQALGLSRSAMIFDGIWAVPTIQQFDKKLQIGAFLVPPDSASQKPQVDWYVDGDMALNAHISNSAEAAAALKVVQYTATTPFGQLFSNVAGEISPIKGVEIPSQYNLSVQAYKWFQQQPINPPFGIRSPMDTPPVIPVTSKQVTGGDKGIFDAEQAVVLPLITNKMSAQQAAAHIQSALAWYFKSTR